MNYLIVENHKSYSIALNESGRFIRVANLNYSVGQTVNNIYVLEDDKPRSKPLVSSKTIMAISSVAACFLVFVAGLIFFNRDKGLKTFATIYVDINPSISVKVSEDGTVSKIIANNDDGVLLIKAYSWDKKDIDTTMKELVDRAIEQGFLLEGGKVSINIDSPNEVWLSDTGVALRQNLDNYLQERISVTIEIKDYNKSVANSMTGKTSDTTKEETEKPTSPTQKETQSTKRPTEGSEHHGNTSKPTNSTATTKPAKKMITKEEALNIALKKAGLTKDQVSDIKNDLEDDDNNGVTTRFYDIEFEKNENEWEYEIEVDAYTGKILRYEVDN